MAQAKYVKYNGGTQSYYGCSDAKLLSRNFIYEVVQIEDKGWQTNYTLNGVDGYFNSVWFDEVPVYIAVSKSIPELLKPYKCCKICATNDTISYQKVTTSIVMRLIPISSNTYHVITENSVYIVQVV